MKDEIQVVSNLIINYIKPAVEKNNISYNDINPKIVGIYAKLISEKKIEVRKFRDWLEDEVKSSIFLKDKTKEQKDFVMKSHELIDLIELEKYERGQNV